MNSERNFNKSIKVIEVGAYFGAHYLIVTLNYD
jgi:hypothetical protein